MLNHYAIPALLLTLSQGSLALEVLTVHASNDTGSYTTDALVEATRQSVIAAQTSGRVVQRPLEAGARMRAGQLLIQIDDRNAMQAEAASRAQVAAAQARLNNAAAELERTRALVQQKYLSQAVLDRAEAAQRAALAEVNALTASAGVSSTQRSFNTLLAPYDGLVAAAHVQVGDMAVPGKPLLTVYDPSAMRVSASVSPLVLSTWLREQACQVTVGGQTYVASQVTVLPVTDSASQLVQVRADLPAGTKVLPGQFAKLLLPVRDTSQIRIPESALVRRGELTAVYVIDEKGNPRLRQVRSGRRISTQTNAQEGNNSQALIEISAGLLADEKIASDPIAAAHIRQSEKHNPQTNSENSPANGERQ